MCLSALKRFAILLYDSDDAQTHSIAAQMNAQGVPRIKRAFLFGRNCVSGQKICQKMRCLWFRYYTTETLGPYTNPSKAQISFSGLQVDGKND